MLSRSEWIETMRCLHSKIFACLDKTKQHVVVDDLIAELKCQRRNWRNLRSFTTMRLVDIIYYVYCFVTINTEGNFCCITPLAEVPKVSQVSIFYNPPRICPTVAS